MKDGVSDGGEGLTGEGQDTGEHAVENDGKGEQTYADRWVLPRAARSHVVRAPEHVFGRGQLRAHDMGDPEVHDLWRVDRRDHDVARLDVAMHDALGVRESQRVENIARDPHRLRHREGLRLEGFRSVWPFTYSITMNGFPSSAWPTRRRWRCSDGEADPRRLPPGKRCGTSRSGKRRDAPRSG